MHWPGVAVRQPYLCSIIGAVVKDLFGNAHIHTRLDGASSRGWHRCATALDIECESKRGKGPPIMIHDGRGCKERERGAKELWQPSHCTVRWNGNFFHSVPWFKLMRMHTSASLAWYCKNFTSSCKIWRFYNYFATPQKQSPSELIGSVVCISSDGTTVGRRQIILSGCPGMWVWNSDVVSSCSRSENKK